MTRRQNIANGSRLWSQSQPKHYGLFARAAAGASHTAGLLICVTFAAFFSLVARAEIISIVVASNAAPRVKFGAERLLEALKAVKLDAAIVGSPGSGGKRIVVGNCQQTIVLEELARSRRRFGIYAPGKEGFLLVTPVPQVVLVAGNDDSGALYGCLELAKRIRDAGSLPADLVMPSYPAMKLRGTCVGMQKTTILPGRKVYEYPYTPELFPWFYDKTLWREYLDFLVANRMNTLYLWNGHPFASLVRLPNYPDAVEVPPEVFAQNVEMFRWLTTECDRRGIWLVQMFYNIFLPKPLAEKHGVSTQLAAPTPLAADYTRKSIAAFVKQYPNVGLMICLGEALQGTENQINWATNTILPGMLDGMKAAGLKEQPPVVIRTHAMNPEAIMPACFTVYSNLFTETKYNGESLTTYEPRGKAAETHRNMAKLGPHLVNVHILSNLEPFRYGATEFIRKSILASRDRLGASGLHLYPLSYWNWPYSPDIANPPLKQWERDWIWLEAWARYAWNPDVPEAEDRAYWVGRLANFYGCDTNAAGKIHDAYNAAGEVAPMLIRRFGITEGNRQTLSLGMTLDQLVNPKKYGAIEELWLSQAPPGERLDEYVRKELNHEPHIGETPESVCRQVLENSHSAITNLGAAPWNSGVPSFTITKNRDEFSRLQSDIRCIRLLGLSYVLKVRAALHVLRYDQGKDIDDLDKALVYLGSSTEAFDALTSQAGTAYRFANSMQTGHRKIPFPGAANGVGTNYHWTHVLPLYEKELADFQAQVAELKTLPPRQSETATPVAAWPAAQFTLLSTNAETFEVKLGARPFADRKYTLTELAPELKGLTGIRFSHEEAKNGRYVPIEFEIAEPVRVLIGYFQSERDLWLQVPNLDFASHADERGGIDAVLRNAAAIDECPNVNVHAFRYEPGRHKLELIGKGSFVVLGVVPQSVKLGKQDARLGAQ